MFNIVAKKKKAAFRCGLNLNMLQFTSFAICENLQFTRLHFASIYCSVNYNNVICVFYLSLRIAHTWFDSKNRRP